jgi:hypothetical protein
VTVSVNTGVDTVATTGPVVTSRNVGTAGFDALKVICIAPFKVTECCWPPSWRTIASALCCRVPAKPLAPNCVMVVVVVPSIVSSTLSLHCRNCNVITSPTLSMPSLSRSSRLVRVSPDTVHASSIGPMTASARSRTALSDSATCRCAAADPAPDTATSVPPRPMAPATTAWATVSRLATLRSMVPGGPLSSSPSPPPPPQAASAAASARAEAHASLFDRESLLLMTILHQG